MTPARITVRTLETGCVDDARLAALRSTLDEAERAQADRFAFDADRRDYLVAHGLRRQLLGRALGVAPEALRFAVDEPRGKPRLAWPEHTGIDFNLSHTHGLVACAWTAPQPSAASVASVGVDCESAERPIDDELAEVFCNPAELAALRDQAATQRVHVWVLKEALLKASGRGLELPLHEVHIGLDPARVLGVPARMGDAADWQVEHWHPTPRHITALAWRSTDGASPTVEHGHGLE